MTRDALQNTGFGSFNEDSVIPPLRASRLSTKLVPAAKRSSGHRINECQCRIALPDGGSVSAVATASDAQESALFFAHGAAADMHHPFMRGAAAGLADRHIATLRFQFPYAEAGKRRVDTPTAAHAAVGAAVRHATRLWPKLPLVAGGKSFGGRMTSHAQALEPMPGVLGLIFLGFPLHPAGKPSLQRALNLDGIGIPKLRVRGTRDALSAATEHGQLIQQFSTRATRADIDGADHSLAVLKRSGRTNGEALQDALDWLLVWIQAVACGARGNGVTSTAGAHKVRQQPGSPLPHALAGDGGPCGRESQATRSGAVSPARRLPEVPGCQVVQHRLTSPAAW